MNNKEKFNEFQEIIRIKKLWLLIILIILSTFLILKKGLIFGIDIAGGSTATIKPINQNLSKDDLENIRQVFETRFNTFGLTNMNIYYKKDLNNEYFFIIEAPNLNEEQIRDFITKEGKFEAYIGNNLVFTGKDVKRVGKFSNNFGDTQCFQDANKWICKGSISLTISNKAAKRFAEITKNLSIIDFGDSARLNETIDFYLDGKSISNLTISADLKGKAATTVSISLSGEGKSKSEALKNLEYEIKKMRGILQSGALPTKFELIQINNFDPSLGKSFLKNIILIGLISIILIAFVIFLKYPYYKLSLLVIFSLFSELILILGMASLINWNLDLPSLIGILVAIGTGVDDLIVMADKAIRRLSKFEKRLEEAYDIVLASWMTTFVAMLPLFFLGLGLLKGFALTTILGITIGVFITRPVFRDILKVLIRYLEKKVI